MKKKIPVRTIITRLFCDHCNTEMERSSRMLCSYPPQYEYECDKCGHKEHSYTNYPAVSYKEEEKEEERIDDEKE